jgi:hypothetical protein
MPINPPQYNLSLPDALERLEVEVEKNHTQTNTPELEGMTPDEAYDVGYETALRDIKSLTGPNPIEVAIVTVEYREKDSTE